MGNPFPRQNLRDRLADYILDSIIRGELRPGHRIIERQLSQHLGISQTTLREALLMLEHIGVITKVNNRGSFIAKLTVKNVEDLYAVRKQLEPFAAGLAYGHMKQSDYHGLTTIISKMKSCVEGRDHTGLSMADATFHRLIWRLSGNNVLVRTLNSVCTPFFALVLVDAYIYDPHLAVHEHTVLFEALKKGGTDDVRRTFEENIEISRARDVKNILALQNPARTGQKVELREGFQKHFDKELAGR